MEKVQISKRDVIQTVIGVLYDLAPSYKPRRIDEIIEQCCKFCDERIGNEFVIHLDEKEVWDFVKDMIYDFEAFRQLNLSQAEIDSGITDCDDPNRKGGFAVCFVGHDDNGDVVSIETTKDYNDFIDLDAAVQNIVYELKQRSVNSTDCMFCKYAKEYFSDEPSGCVECQTCIHNPKYKSNYVSHPKSLLPMDSDEYKNYSE